MEITPWYLLLLLVRLLFVFTSTGYIHPDGYFQSSEVMAGRIFDVTAHVSWEFQLPSPIRSVVSPALSSGLPYMVITGIERLLGVNFHSGTVLYYAPRLWMFVVSLVLDRLTYDIAMTGVKQKRFSTKGNHQLMVLGSSWTTLTFMVTGFSNTIEHVIFAACLWLAVKLTRDTQRSWWCNHVMFGVLVSAGTWTRFTFMAFIAPVPLFLLYAQWRRSGLFRALVCGVSMLTGLLFGAALWVTCDTLFYESEVTLRSLLQGQIPHIYHVTPWSNLQYNTKVENLAQHVLHPHYLHATVNGVLMFGPLWLLFLWYLPRVMPRDPWHLTLMACCVTGVGVLSLAPHQEPRFILPLLTPLTLLFSEKIVSKWWSLWLLFNMLVAVFFGYCHQSGVVPSLLFLGTATSVTPGEHSIIYYHTYMPPRHLLALPTTLDKTRVIDLQGADYDMLTGVIAKTQATDDQTLWLVAPGSVRVPSEQLYECRVYNWHVSTEDLPRAWSQRGLRVWSTRPVKWCQ